MKKLLLTFTAIAFFSSVASAQFDKENLSFGGGAGFHSYSNDIGGSLIFNLRTHYALDEKSSINIGFNYQLPITETFKQDLIASSSATTPRSVEVDAEVKLVFTNIFAEYNFYFLGDLEEDFGMYGLGGAGLTFATVSSGITSAYDKTKYLDGYTSPEESYTGFTINLGLGANFKLSDQIALFGETRICIPATETNNTTIDNPIPFSYGFGLGVRFSPFY